MRPVHFTMEIAEDLLLLYDLGSALSITNGAEQVLVELAMLMPTEINRFRIIYRDTMGRWDGIAHTGSVFIGFVPLNTNDKYDAMRIARAISSWPRMRMPISCRG